MAIEYQLLIQKKEQYESIKNIILEIYTITQFRFISQIMFKIIFDVEVLYAGIKIKTG